MGAAFVNGMILGLMLGVVALLVAERFALRPLRKLYVEAVMRGIELEVRVESLNGILNKYRKAMRDAGWRSASCPDPAKEV